MKKALQVYVFQKPFGSNAEGDRIDLEADEAEPLVSAGVLAEASQEDVGADDGDGDEAMGDEPVNASVATRAVDRLTKNIEKSIATALDKVVNKSNRNVPSVPAEVKQPVFSGVGDMVRAMYRAKMKGDTRAWNRLAAYQDEIKRKSPIGMGESSNNIGGYAVIPNWYESIWDKARDYPRLLDMCDRRPIAGDTLNIPAISEANLQDGTRHGGVLAYWVAEGSAATASYPALTQVQAVINTQVVLSYVSNQLLEDISYPLDSYLQKQVGNEFVFQENVSVVSGSGTSQPKGILNQPSLVTITKASGDTTGMFSFPDLVNMYKRLWAPSRKNAVFLVTPVAMGTLMSMTFPTASGTYSAFGGVTFDSHDEFQMRVFGRPVIECLSLPQIGTLGDVILADLSQLVVAEKSGMQVDISDAVRFTTLETAFRFVRRYDIQSPWTAACGAYNAADPNSFSPFLALQSRGS